MADSPPAWSGRFGTPATAQFRDLDQATAACYTLRLPDMTGTTCIA